MDIEEDNEAKQTDQFKVQVFSFKKNLYAVNKEIFQCLDCYCIGVLNRKGDKAYLVPEQVLSTRSIRTRKRDLKKISFKQKVTAKLSLLKHGFATPRQQAFYLGNGSIFWAMIILIS